MNAAHYHLLLNHLPPLGALFGFLLLAAAVARKSGELVRVSFVVFVVVGVLALPTYFTGEPAEEVVEHMPGVTESVIEPHEESAETSLVTALVLGAVALVVLIFYRNREIPRGYTLGALALALVVTAMMAWTAHLGGKIRHVEVRGDSAGLTAPAEED